MQRLFSLAGGGLEVVRFGPHGEYIAVKNSPGDKWATFRIKNKLSAAGFRWDGAQQWWYIDSARIAKNPTLLTQFGLQVPGDEPEGEILPATVSPSPVQPVTPAPVPAPAAQAEPVVPPPETQQPKKNWILCEHLENGGPVVVSRERTPNGEIWLWEDPDGGGGTGSLQEISQVVKTLKDEKGKLYQSVNPDELYGIFYDLLEKKLEPQDITGPLQPKTDEQRMKHFIPAASMSEEQQAIDKLFGQNTQNIVMKALAGSGKTSMLEHLAWKYGDSGQKWSYLVFNKKNKADALKKFPPWVKVETTNGFLGKVLEGASAKGIVPKTTRMIQMKTAKGGSGDPKKKQKAPEKTDLLVDGPQFGGLMRSFKLSPLNQDQIERTLSHPNVRDYAMGRDGGVSFMAGMVNTTLKNIRGVFRYEVKKLTDLAKAFAADPRDPKQMRNTINHVISQYDMDFEMRDIKERISKYKSNFQDQFLASLNAVLGYDFMSKSFQDEMVKGSEWLLAETMPGVSDHVYIDPGGKKHRLGDYRDFNDDLWYTALYADKIKWDKYQFVFADEFQDFNDCQIKALLKLREKNARVVVVGDSNQRIYRFRGTNDDAFGMAEKALDVKQQSSLTKNFRSFPAIIDFSNQNTLVKDLRLGVRIPLKELQGYLQNPNTSKEDSEYYKQVEAQLGSPIDINALKKAIDGGYPWPPSCRGEVLNQTQKYDEGFETLDTEFKNNNLMQTCFLSRTNAPLASAALKLLGKGVPFVILGKDIASDLLKHIDTLSNAKARGSDWRPLGGGDDVGYLADRLTEFFDSETESHGNKSSKRGYLQDLKDITDALNGCIAEFMKHQGTPQSVQPQAPERDVNFYDEDAPAATPSAAPGPVATKATIKGLKDWLSSRLKGLDFDNEDEGQAMQDAETYNKSVENAEHPPVVLSTVHKAKGLEWDRVNILRYDLFPHPKSRLPKDLEEEERMRYVAITRAKKKLNIVKLEGQPGYVDKGSN